jgi:hypothetical protein
LIFVAVKKYWGWRPKESKAANDVVWGKKFENRGVQIVELAVKKARGEWVFAEGRCDDQQNTQRGRNSRWQCNVMMENHEDRIWARDEGETRKQLRMPGATATQRAFQPSYASGKRRGMPLTT